MWLRPRYAWALATPATALVVLMFVLPLIYFLRYSLSTGSQPDTAVVTVENFMRFFASAYYRATLLRTVLIAVAATVLTLVLALPVAYVISKASARVKAALVILAVFPLLVGDVVRAIGWVAFLGYSGPVVNVLTRLGVLGERADLLHTSPTMAVAIACVVLPVMVLTLVTALESVNPATERAALSLGARPLRAFRQVVVPQIMPALVAGTSLVFVLSINAYSTPVLVGGSQVPMLAPEVYASVSKDNDWPFGAAIAVVLLVVSLAVVVLYGTLLRRQFEKWQASSR